VTMIIARVDRRRILAEAMRVKGLGNQRAKSPFHFFVFGRQQGRREETINGVRGKKSKDQIVKENPLKRHSLEAMLLKGAFTVILLAAIVLFVINNYFPAAADRLFGSM